MAVGDPEPLRRFHVSDALRAWVEEFQPEVIYSDFSTLTELRFVRQLVSLTGAALATHTLDDWPQSRYNQGVFAAYARYRLRKELQSIFNQASLRIGICDKMCQEYEDRYGLPFIPFHNVVERETWEGASQKSWRARTPFRLVHSGNIGGVAKIQSLLDICQVVRELHNSGKSIELRIHTLPTKASLYRSILENPPSVTVHDPPGNRDFVSLLSGADLLVLPVDFGAERIIYYKYSMPTRMPAYMMSGTPILVYGPPEVAVVEYAQKAGLGYIVSQRDLIALKEAIILLSSKVELRRQLGIRAQELAVEHHSADKVREAFRQAMQDAASHRG
jgi:glycosyltransferase involved in cell wall biosynthesis